MEEEKKTYPITGTVTISTEEYRDLIEQKVAVLEEKISAENDEARARESEPKDYSVEEIPMPTTEVQMDISFDSENPQVTAVGIGVSSS